MGEFMVRFFGHGGRITRKTMWLGFLALVVIAILIEIVLAWVFGVNMMGQNHMADTNISETGERMPGMMARQGWMQLIMLAVLAYPVSALMFKRSHDRNTSGLLVIVYLCLAALTYIIMIIGLASNAGEVGFMGMPSQTWLFTGVQGIYLLLGLYLLVTLGFLPGTKGSNLYGADPSGK